MQRAGGSESWNRMRQNKTLSETSYHIIAIFSLTNDGEPGCAWGVPVSFLSHRCLIRLILFRSAPLMIALKVPAFRASLLASAKVVAAIGAQASPSPP